MQQHLPLQQYVLSEPFECRPTIHILWPACKLANYIIYGQSHATDK